MSSPPIPPPPLVLRQKRSRSKSIVVGSLIVVVCLAVLWSCGKGAYHNYILARAAVDHFHGELDQADYEGIYESETDALHHSASHGDQIKVFDNIHQKMGNSGKMSAKGFHINWRNSRVVVDEVYSTQFALGEGQESFVWVIENNQPRLEGYHITSSNLR